MRKVILDFIWLSGGGASTSFINYASLTVNAEETIQFVTVTKQNGMNADYSDVRFIIDPNGTDVEKIYLPYELLSYTETNAFFKVSNNVPFTTASLFYYVWGKANALSISNPYVTAFHGGWVTNYMSRTAKYEVQNVLAGADYLLDGPGNATQEANWSCKTQLPLFQTEWGKPVDDDWNNVYIGYKYDADDNIHAGSPTSKSALKYTLDFGTTWSARQFIYDPDADHRSTSTSTVAIPTVGATEVTFTVEAGRAWVPGDIARAFNDGTHYFWFTVTSYSGTTLVGTRLSNTGTGTFASWVISQRFGSTNTVITSVKKPDGITRLIAAFTKYDFYNAILRVYSSYSDLTNGVPGAWSTPVRIGPDSWVNVGGQACTTHDGLCFFPMHENAIDTTEYYSTVAYTRDYGVTFDFIRTTSYPGTVLLDETDLLPEYDDALMPINQIRATCRNEDATTSNHQYKYVITWDENTVSSSGIEENDWYDSTLSRYTSVRCPDKKTVYWGGGDATGKQIYSPDNLNSFHPVPYPTLSTGVYTARRVYYTMAVHPDGRKMDIWSSNKQPNGSDLYISYSDWTYNNLYTDSLTTLTDYAGINNRPLDLSPGIRIASVQVGYRTSSLTSISVPTGAGQQRTLTVDTGLNWTAGNTGTCVYTTNNGVRFTFTVVSYNSGNGELVVEWISNTGTGTQATWQLNKTENLIANQSFLSRVLGNGRIRPMKASLRVKSYGTGLVTGGFFGFKKFETRALAVVTITNAGAEGDTITIKWTKSGTYSGLFGGVGTLGTYAVQSGDTISDVVAGLVASVNALRVSKVSSSDATTLTVMAPFGNNTAINGQALSVVVTGTVAGSSGNFAGGTAIESSTSLSNIITFDNANNVVRIEEANDNHNQALTITDGPNDYVIEWEDVLVSMSNETATKTKGPATGSGVPNWEGQLIFFVTTSTSSPQGLLDVMEFIVEPLDQTPPTEGSPVSGIFTERADGLGLN